MDTTPLQAASASPCELVSVVDPRAHGQEIRRYLVEAVLQRIIYKCAVKQ